MLRAGCWTEPDRHLTWPLIHSQPSASAALFPRIHQLQTGRAVFIAVVWGSWEAFYLFCLGLVERPNHVVKVGFKLTTYWKLSLNSEFLLSSPEWSAEIIGMHYHTQHNLLICQFQTCMHFFLSYFFHSTV